MTFTDAKREKEDEAEDAIARASRDAEQAEGFGVFQPHRLTGSTPVPIDRSPKEA